MELNNMHLFKLIKGIRRKIVFLWNFDRVPIKIYSALKNIILGSDKRAPFFYDFKMVLIKNFERYSSKIFCFLAQLSTDK